MTKKPMIINYLRFSSPEQAKGDSARRQIQRSVDYGRDQGEESHETLRLEDRGLSAYYGHHRTKGDLGRLLKQVEEGKIPKGSELRVEGFDRLSRENVLDAFQSFSSIIRAGIKVITLVDNMEYTKESLNANPAQLMLSLTYMYAAHLESKKKSDWLSNAWSGKLVQAQKKKKRLTKKCPAWLEPQEEGDWFYPIEDRCRVIEQIYSMYDEGKGKRLIEKELNQGDGWKPKNGWRKSYIDKILRNPACIGLFQPHRKLKGKRVPVGGPINNYYPKVISDELFYRVQDRLDRNLNHGGRTGKVNNLFSHIAKCGYCGASMELVSKGKLPRGGLYLVCDSARRGRGCAYYSIKYEGFERLLLNYSKGLRVDEVLPEKEKQSELAQLKSQSSAVAGEFGQVQDRIANLTDSIADTEDKRVRQALQRKLSELLDDRESLEENKSWIEAKIAQLSKARESIEEQLQSIEQLWDYMQFASEEKLIEVRLRLRDKLRQLIRKIIVFPVGPAIMTPELVEEVLQAVLDVQPEIRATDEIEKFKEHLEKKIDNKEEQLYILIFEGGSYRWLKPHHEPPLMAEIDIDTGESRFIMDGELKPLPKKYKTLAEPKLT